MSGKQGNRTPAPKSSRHGRTGASRKAETNPTTEEKRIMTSLGFRPMEGITVFGEASRDATPEIVELFFEIHSVGPNGAMALQENGAKTVQVSQALGSIGKGQVELKTGGAAVWPVLQPSPLPLPLNPGPPMIAINPLGAPSPTPSMLAPMMESPIMGYHAVTPLKVRVTDPHRVGEVVEAVTRAGSGVAVSIRFLVRDEENLRRTLLEEAVRECRHTADALAAALGKTAGTPVSVFEDFVDGNRQLPSATWPPGAPRTFAPHPLTFVARVGVTYQLQ